MMRDLRGQSAVVTGASSGIGYAVAHALAESGLRLLLSGRDPERLAAACAGLPEVGIPHQFVTGDLATDEGLHRIADAAIALGDGVAVLVSSAGAYDAHSVGQTPTEVLDRMLNVNLRGPYLLVRELLPEIIRVQGQIVFVNSSVVENPRANVAAYAASKAGLEAFANCLRAEVNAAGVRVLSVYPGRTATPMQAELNAKENREYRPERLLQPEDIARAVIGALTLPLTAEVTDLYIRPNLKS